MARNYVIGWDVAQANDASIIMIAEMSVDGIITIADIVKLPERMSYVDQVAVLVDMQHHYAGAKIAVDRTGVGAGVCDIARKAGLNPYEVMFTAGQNENRAGRKVTLPKQMAVNLLTIAIQARRIKVPMLCRNRALLKQEIKEFEANINANGRTTYNGGGKHDDTISALMLVVWMLTSKTNGEARDRFRICGAERGGNGNVKAWNAAVSESVPKSALDTYIDRLFGVE